MQSGRQGVEVLSARLGDGDHIFDAQASDGFAVEPGFDGDDIADDEWWAFEIEQWWFVDIEPDAMPCAVGHGGVGVRVGVFGDAEAVAVACDDIDGGFVDIFAGGAGFGCVLGSSFGFGDSSVHFDELVGDVAMADGAGAVAVVSGGADVGEEVDDDGLRSVKDTGSSVVAVCADGSASDD